MYDKPPYEEKKRRVLQSIAISQPNEDRSDMLNDLVGQEVDMSALLTAYVERGHEDTSAEPTSLTF